jgi:GPH family glycoside/pentoside/hexuronide:cation symporter
MSDLASTSGAPVTGLAKLSVFEKIGYSAADSAANFVFMSMILFQTSFYTDVFKLSATAAAAILLWPRLWDAVADPIVGILADRTNTRWGKFRPWVFFTAVPWCVVMILAYTVPNGWSMGSLIAYAAITNTLLMTIYSMNNMPYAALGGVMTADVNERTSLNSYRFVAVNIAQFIVGGFTLPLVAKFAARHKGDPGATAHGWQMTMTVWAILCLMLFMITFFSTKERIQPVSKQKSSVKDDFSALFKNNPWKIMFGMTMVHFAILAGRGAALYNYYHHYVDRAAMFDWLEKVGLTAAPLAPGEETTGILDHWLGYIVHGTRSDLAVSNVADVFNSIVNMAGTATTIVVILLSVNLAKRFGKKAVAVTGFGLAALNAAAFYFLSPTDVTAMLVLTITGSIVYAPTIALVWAIYADVADFSEWKTGRRFTGIVFATIGFALKSGLALGSAGFLWIMAGCFHYDSSGSPLFADGDTNHIASLSDVAALAAKLKTPTDAVSTFLQDKLSPETKQALAGFQDTPASRSALEALLMQDLNKVIAGPAVYDEKLFAAVELRQSTKDALAQKDPSAYDLMSLNRQVLEDAYPIGISRQHNQTDEANQGFRSTSAMVVSLLFAICTVLLGIYPITKTITIQMADELAERRKKFAAA